MKRLILGWLLLAGTLLPAGTTKEGDGENLLRLRSQQLSARLLLQEWQKTFARDSFPEGEAAMQQEMQQNVAANGSVSAARRNTRRRLNAELRSAYRREAEKRIAPFAASLSTQEKTSLMRGNETFFRERENALFEPAFHRTRTAVTSGQRTRIFRQIYPSAEELESMDDERLTAALETRFKKGIPEQLYEENAACLRKDLIAPAIREGRTQQTLQLQLIQETAIPGNLWDAGPVQDHLTRHAERELARRIPDAARRYPLFSGTRKRIAQRAQELPVRRVAEHFSTEFPAEAYDRMLRETPKAHQTRKQSLDAVAEQWTRQWITDALQLAKPPKAWETRLKNDSALQLAAGKHLRQFASEMAPIRTAFAKEQLKRYWPELAQGEWLPEAEAVERYAASDRKELPSGLPEIHAEEILEETSAEESQLLRNALEREVLRLEAQRKAISAVYDAILAQMENRQQENMAKEGSWFLRLFRFGSPANVQLEEVERCYREEVVNRSSKPLFPSMEEEIRVRARAILAQILTPEPQPEKQQNDPEPPKKELTMELILSGEEGAFAFRIDGWNHTESGIADAGRATAAEIRRRIGQSGQEEQSVTIRITVAGNRIYYHSVAELREALKQAVPGCTVEDSLPQTKETDAPRL